LGVVRKGDVFVQSKDGGRFPRGVLRSGKGLIVVRRCLRPSGMRIGLDSVWMSKKENLLWFSIGVTAQLDKRTEV
jgi:hypothetical protein